MVDKPSEKKEFESAQAAYNAIKTAVEERADLSRGIIVAFIDHDGMRVMSMKASLHDMMHLRSICTETIREDMLEGLFEAKH